jgi:hypothetical protein
MRHVALRWLRSVVLLRFCPLRLASGASYRVVSDAITFLADCYASNFLAFGEVEFSRSTYI